MIKALDENPEKCGYTVNQISDGLKFLASKSVKQIGSDASHLYYMLLNKGFVVNNAFTRKLAAEHSEIMKLRFDQERSNLEDLPLSIRKPLFSILSKYSEGAVKRIDGQWADIKLDDEFLNSTKYKFDER